MNEAELVRRVRAEHGNELRRRVGALLDETSADADPDRLRREAHTLRGAASACGVTGAAVAIDAFEAALAREPRDVAAASAAARLLLLEVEQTLTTASASSVLHDLRSSLNVVLGYARLLEDGEPDERRRGWASSIAEASERIAVLVDRLDRGVPARALAPPRPRGEPPTPTASIADFTVLLVEDDPATTTLVLETLAHVDGVAAHAVASIAEALDPTRASPFDLVLLDGRLPDGGALEALERLQTGSGAPPVIVVTADAELAYHDELRAAGARQVLAKPVAPAELVAAVMAARSSRPVRGTDRESS